MDGGAWRHISGTTGKVKVQGKPLGVVISFDGYQGVFLEENAAVEFLN